MPSKVFEHTIRFFSVQTNAGETVTYPIVTVELIQEGGNRVSLPLLFDTGASVTTLQHDLFPLLGLTSWDIGDPVQTATAGSENAVTAYRYEATLEFLGKIIRCPVHLQKMPQNPLFIGLFGRAQVFQEYGFGF